MQRLANFEVGRRISGKQSQRIARLAFGIACGFLMVIIRSSIDLRAPGAGPFALVYPTVLLATLYGRWEAGIAAFATSFLWGWFMVLPPGGTFYVENPADHPRIVVNFVAGVVVLVFAEVFRGDADLAIRARNEEIERRKTLMQELEHRTRNNFALVLSLLSLQRRDAHSEETTVTIDEAINRIRSFAEAYTDLSSHKGESVVAMGPYLTSLLEKVTPVVLRDGITISTKIGDCDLPRENAVAIGLFTNEALTNAAKHAFGGRDRGQISVIFECEGDRWSLIVSDDGVGKRDGQEAKSDQLGTRLFAAFAQQARANYRVESNTDGRTLRLVSKATPL